MNVRYAEMEVKSKSEALDKVSVQHESLRVEHEKVTDDLRMIRATHDATVLERDCLSKQNVQEMELRKTYQQQASMQAGQLSAIQRKLELATEALLHTQEELKEALRKNAQTEARLHETHSSSALSNSRHQKDLESFEQRMLMLERMIADERTQRRSIVHESNE